MSNRYRDNSLLNIKKGEEKNGEREWSRRIKGN